jgi:hypothetical protein
MQIDIFQRVLQTEKKKQTNKENKRKERKKDKVC